jgi:hypothetical protein
MTQHRSESEATWADETTPNPLYSFARPKRVALELMEHLERVQRLERDAARAIDELQVGGPDGEADRAFRTLLMHGDDPDRRA